MYVDYFGWHEKTGPFSYKVFVDETRQDHVVHFANGQIARQKGPFQNVTADWNHDGDVYSQFGAWFDYLSPDGQFQGGEFLTPVSLVQMAAVAQGFDSPGFGATPTLVEGIRIGPDRHPSLAEQVARSENRAANQEAERNRKMASLGIRHPDDPRVR